MSKDAGTTYDFIRIPIPHPECGKTGLYRLREAIENEVVLCAYCGEAIDLSSENWRSVLGQLAEEYKQIKKLR